MANLSVLVDGVERFSSDFTNLEFESTAVGTFSLNADIPPAVFDPPWETGTSLDGLLEEKDED